jgi:hypothetical protein
MRQRQSCVWNVWWNVIRGERNKKKSKFSRTFWGVFPQLVAPWPPPPRHPLFAPRCQHTIRCTPRQTCARACACSFKRTVLLWCKNLVQSLLMEQHHFGHIAEATCGRQGPSDKFTLKTLLSVQSRRFSAARRHGGRQSALPSAEAARAGVQPVKFLLLFIYSDLFDKLTDRWFGLLGLLLHEEPGERQRGGARQVRDGDDGPDDRKRTTHQADHTYANDHRDIDTTPRPTCPTCFLQRRQLLPPKTANGNTTRKNARQCNQPLQPTQPHNHTTPTNCNPNQLLPKHTTATTSHAAAYGPQSTTRCWCTSIYRRIAIAIATHFH